MFFWNCGVLDEHAFFRPWEFKDLVSRRKTVSSFMIWSSFKACPWWRSCYFIPWFGTYQIKWQFVVLFGQLQTFIHIFPKRYSDDVGSRSQMLRTSSFRAGFKRSLLSAEREWVAFVVKEMAPMAMLTTFLWSNKDSDSFWRFKFSFAICKVAEVAQIIDFLITFCQLFCDMEGFFSFGLLPH